MKICLQAALVILVCIGRPAGAQNAPIAPQPTAAGALMAPDTLDQILKPIALYPDPLLAEVFTASTLPAQIVLADRYLTQGGDANAAAEQPWDASIQALVHYPAILTWLDENLVWTTDVGQAFLNQQQDVMDSIQRLRAQAQAEGNLPSTPQENVVADAGTIEIEPTDPAVIYLPGYSWETIYDDPGVYCTFGIGYPIGPWLGYDWDWRNHRVIAWGAGHPRPGDWWRRAPGNRRVPQGAPIWRPSSRVAGGAQRGLDRGYSPETSHPAHVNIPTTRVPQAGLPARPALAARSAAPAVSRPAIESRPAVQTRPAVQSRAPVESRPAPAVRQQPSVGAFSGPESSSEARQSSARGSASRGSMSGGGGGSARKR
jgi:hypothetical protein